MTDTDDQNLLTFEVPEAMQPIVSYLAVGNDDSYENQLITKSRQPHILKYTPNDAGKRFVDHASLKKWLDKGHTMHWLLNADFDLAGIIWYGQKEFPAGISVTQSPTSTFAIRLYEGYVGHHLSIPFMKFSLQIAVRLKQEHHETIEDMWLRTSPSNEAAIASYIKFGYTEVFRDNDNVIMTMSAEELIKIADA